MPGVHLVVQRCDSASILLDNDAKWGTIEKGLVVYVSFSKEATATDVSRACLAIVSLPLLTRGVWGDGHKPEPLAELLRAGVSAEVMVVPQASLVSKAKSKTLQYHGQIDKEAGKVLYEQFCRELAECCHRALLGDKGGGGKKKEAGAGGDAARVPPCEYFKTGAFAGKFSEFDDRGVPSGAEVSAKQKKKYERLYATACAKWEKAQTAAGAGGSAGAVPGGCSKGAGAVDEEAKDHEVRRGAAGDAAEAAVTDPLRAPVDTPATTADSGQHLFKVVSGTFGNRQVRARPWAPARGRRTPSVRPHAAPRSQRLPTPRCSSLSG